MKKNVASLLAIIAALFILVSCDQYPKTTGCWFVQNVLDEDITITMEKDNLVGEPSVVSFVLHPYDIHTIATSDVCPKQGYEGLYGEAIEHFKESTNKVIITYKGTDYSETSSDRKSIINLGSYVFFPVNDNTGDQKFLFVIDEEYLNSLTVEDSEE